jgi:hypothetical protein
LMRYHSSQGSLTMSQEFNNALIRLSPPPSDRDYLFNMNQGESLADLFAPDSM